MRKASLLMAALLAAAGCGSQGYPSYPPTISVNGIGSARAEPDMAVISFGFYLSDTDPEAAVQQGAEKAESAISSAVSAGVSRENITTTGYSLWVEDEYDYMTYTYTGRTLYHLEHTMKVTVTDTDAVGGVMAALISGGANTIHSVNFTVEDRAALYARAREAALNDASATAGQLASALNATITGVYSVSEWEDFYGSYGGYGSYEDYGIPLDGGKQSVTLNVNISYTIKQ